MGEGVRGEGEGGRIPKRKPRKTRPFANASFFLAMTDQPTLRIPL